MFCMKTIDFHAKDWRTCHDKPSSLSQQDIIHSARKACHLLWRQRGRWLCIAALFMILQEALSLIPYAGVFLKLLLASILSTQFLHMHMMAEHGRQPGLFSMFAGFRLPWSALVLLLFASLLTFVLCMLTVYGTGGLTTLLALMGTTSLLGSANGMQLLQCKLSMQILGALLGFLPASLILTRLPAAAALRLTLTNIVINPQVIMIMLGIGFATEVLSFAIPQLLGRIAFLLVLPLLVFLVLWLPAFRYTTGKLAFS